MEAIEEALLILFSTIVVVSLLYYLLQYSEANNLNSQISIIKNLLSTSIKIVPNINNITIINSQNPIQLDVFISEQYLSGNSVLTYNESYKDVVLSPSTILNLTYDDPVSVYIEFNYPENGESVFTYYYRYPINYLDIKNLYSGTAVYINNNLEKISLYSNLLPLNSSYNNVTLISKYFYYTYQILTNGYGNVYNITLPINITQRSIYVYTNNGIITKPAVNASVEINDIETLRTNSNGQVSFLYSGNIIKLNICYNGCNNSFYPSISGLYNLSTNNKFIIYEKYPTYIYTLFYANKGSNLYTVVPGSLSFKNTNNNMNYYIETPANYSLNLLTGGYYDVFGYTLYNKTYTQMSDIPVFSNYSFICIPIIPGVLTETNYTCPNALIKSVPPSPTIHWINTTFNEIGLPQGSYWNVTYGGITISSESSTIVFNYYINNQSTANFTVPNQKVYGELFVASPRKGRLTAGSSQTIIFRLPNVTFEEIGLPANTLWNVTYNNTLKSSRTQYINFSNENTTNFNFTVGSPILINSTAGYFANITKGTIGYDQSLQKINFTEKFYLNETPIPLSGGKVSPGSGWYDANSIINISETPNNYYVFKEWQGYGNGNYTGTNSIAKIILKSPLVENAIYYTPVYITFYANQTILNSTANVLNVNSANYIYNNPIAKLEFAYNSLVSYTYANSITYNNGIKQVFSSLSGCGQTTESGSFYATQNCSITGNYITVKAVSFEEVGLPSNTMWNVTFNNQFESSNTPYVNYTYGQITNSSFKIGSPIYISNTIRYIANPSNGIIATNQINQTIDFIEQFYFNEFATPTNGASKLSPGSGWYNASSTLTISETPNTSYAFIGWNGIGNGSYTGNSVSANIIMNSPITENAVYNYIPPTIYLNETNSTIDVGQISDLYAIVTGGTPPYSYAWYNATTSNSGIITGSTTNSLIIKGVTTGTFKYFVNVTDSHPATVESNTISLIVNPPLMANPITPTNAVIAPGQSITLTANPSGGTQPYSYQWYSGTSSNCLNDAPISGATSNTITVSPSSSTYYCYKVTDSASTPESNMSTADLITVSLILYEVPITITNSQSSATPSPFQQMIQINESNYANYIAYNGNIANFEFFTQSGSVLPAWIESNNSGTLTVWVKLPNGIPASSSITIYLGFSSKTKNLLNASGTFGIGEAPQLSSTYAEYDDGSSVFNNYWNFAGTSLPSGWNVVSNSGYAYASVNNGLTVTSSNTGGHYVAVISNMPVTSTTLVDEYITSQYTNNGQDMCLVSSANSTSFSYEADSVGFQNGALLEIENNNGGAPSVIASTNINAPAIVSVYNNILYANYNQVASISGQILANGYLTLSANTGYNADFVVQWLRTRAYPPNGVMPSVSFGSIQQV